MTEDLKKLREIVNQSIDNIVAHCERHGEEFPSLNNPADPSEFTPNSLRNDPLIADAITLGVSAAAQLIATIQNPAITAYFAAFKCNVSACMLVAERMHVAEILREAGSKGLHVEDIAAKNNIDPKKLTRILRFLATNYIFKEVAPDVFANNLISSCLDTGKGFEQIKSNLIAKFDNTSGVAALASVFSEDLLEASSHLLANITDISTAFSEEPNAAPVQRAFNTNADYWDILEKPENAHRFRRFGASMPGALMAQSPLTIIQSFDWSTVPKGGVIVDVGCGIGNVSLEVAKIRPDLQIVLQDRPQVIEKTRAYWNSTAPDFVSAGYIHFLGMSFFEPQPTLSGHPNVFVLRAIMHDWSDKYAAKILMNLRAKAVTETKLLVLDSIVDFASPTVPDDAEIQVEGTELSDPPAPLLANLGQANVMAYGKDMAMMTLLNSQERTLSDFRRLLASSGWKLVAVRKHPVNNRSSGIISVPM